jgi:hypothetical protein
MRVNHHDNHSQLPVAILCSLNLREYLANVTTNDVYSLLALEPPPFRKLQFLSFPLIPPTLRSQCLVISVSRRAHQSPLYPRFIICIVCPEASPFYTEEIPVSLSRPLANCVLIKIRILCDRTTPVIW